MEKRSQHQEQNLLGINYRTLLNKEHFLKENQPVNKEKQQQIKSKREKKNNSPAYLKNIDQN